MTQNKAIANLPDSIRLIPETDKVKILEVLASSLVESGRRDDVLRILSEIAEREVSITSTPTSPAPASDSHLPTLGLPRISFGVYGRHPLIR